MGVQAGGSSSMLSNSSCCCHTFDKCEDNAYAVTLLGLWLVAAAARVYNRLRQPGGSQQCNALSCVSKGANTRALISTSGLQKHVTGNIKCTYVAKLCSI